MNQLLKFLRGVINDKRVPIGVGVSASAAADTIAILHDAVEFYAEGGNDSGKLARAALAEAGA